MSQIKPSHLFVTLTMALVLGGCGDKNDKAVFSPDSGHPSGWALTHKTSAKADLETCVDCHGESLNGGISNISCKQCHIEGPTSKHPVAWGDYAYARHKAYVATNGTSSCANASCHGATLAGVGTAPNCATKCHLGGAGKKHPADWPTLSGHKTYLNGIANVSTTCKTAACHGTDGKGVFLSGPACDQCHTMK